MADAEQRLRDAGAELPPAEQPRSPAPVRVKTSRGRLASRKRSYRELGSEGGEEEEEAEGLQGARPGSDTEMADSDWEGSEDEGARLGVPGSARWARAGLAALRGGRGWPRAGAGWCCCAW